MTGIGIDGSNLLLVTSISRMLRTGAIDLEPVVDAPLVVDAETGQPGDRIPLIHLVQADHTFAFLLLQNVLIVTDSRLC